MRLELSVVPRERGLVERGRETLLRFLDGLHRGWWNRGDYASGGVAQRTCNPFLFKGAEPALTDVTVAGAPA